MQRTRPATCGVSGDQGGALSSRAPNALHPYSVAIHQHRRLEPTLAIALETYADGLAPLVGERGQTLV